jgi:hypothetical protein
MKLWPRFLRNDLEVEYFNGNNKESGDSVLQNTMIRQDYPNYLPRIKTLA